MKTLILTLLVMLMCSPVRAEEDITIGNNDNRGFIYRADYKEGNFWRDYKKEQEGWEVIEQDFSHIVYKAPNKRKYAKCHSCEKFIPATERYKEVIDRRGTDEEDKWWISGEKRRPLNYEELYYCDNCACDWRNE